MRTIETDVSLPLLPDVWIYVERGRRNVYVELSVSSGSDG